MKTKGIVIRKMNVDEVGRRSHPSKKQLEKQVMTLHRKLQKSDDVLTEFTIEKDGHGRGLHTHLNIMFKDENNLLDGLKKFIGGNTWNKKNEVLECNGQYGEIQVHNIHDSVGFSRYINKTNPSKNLI